MDSQSSCRGFSRAFSHGFSLVELLVTIAVLVIVLGLMVSLSRHVRAASSDELTHDILRRLDVAMAQYIADSGGKIPRGIPPLIPDKETRLTEDQLLSRALQNNRATLALLAATGPNGPYDDRLRTLSEAYDDGVFVRDAWGSPIVFMDKPHPAVGMTPQGWFFFSAGPDGKYLTRDDNLYSYEEAAK